MIAYCFRVNKMLNHVAIKENYQNVLTLVSDITFKFSNVY